MRPELVRFSDGEELRRALEELGCDPGGFPYFEGKREIYPLRFRGVDSRAANALKQEMLSRGGDVAVHRHAIDRGVATTDCIVFGTAKELRLLAEKLAAMPYWGLDGVRRELVAALEALKKRRWTLPLPRGRSLGLGERTLVMGILNLTEDSFFAGSRVADDRCLLERARAMAEGGADLLDLGAESTRPGAEAKTAEEEIARLVPALRALREVLPDMPLSMDTTKASVARSCVEAGADMVNDISGLGFDGDMASTVAELGVPLVLMHIQGVPRTMQEAPHYASLPGDLGSFFEERLARAEGAGLPRDRIILDPGLGFGKTPAHNLELLKHLEYFRPWGLPLLVGHSRKSTLGRVLGLPDPGERLEATLAVTALCAWQGVEIVRVHDVRENVRVVRTVEAVKHPERWS